MIDTAFAWALMLFAPLIFAYAGSSDLFNMKISNRTILVFLVPFPLFAYGIGMSWMEGLMHLGVGSLTLVICFALWAARIIGGGDAKFASAAALWLGPDLALGFFLMTSIYGAVMSLFFVSFRARMLPPFILKMDWALRLHNVKRIPYGIAFAIAGLQIYSTSDWMQTGIALAMS